MGWQCTTPAKTVADCFRFRRHVGLDVALAALKDYLKMRKGGVSELLEAARADRVDSDSAGNRGIYKYVLKRSS